ncbi:MAG: acyl-CoA dehydrogenase [Verrucomicrobia bacterium]|nr:MAG: acyl-CoA dehydrogenase [Verrucomicrobiota bacterium]
MDSYLNSEQEYLRDSIRKYLNKNLDPHIVEYEKKGEFPADILKDIKQFGMIGGMLDEDHGGMGLSHAEWVMLVEEAGYHWASLRSALNHSCLISKLLSELGSDAQKQQYLEPFMNGDIQGWIGITEPNHGSNVAGIQTKAVKRGGKFIISGSKMFVTWGLIGRFGILVAKTHSDTCDGDLSLFLIDRDATPYGIETVETMILRSTGTALFSFDDIEIPAENLLGEEGKGLKSILKTLSTGRMNVAAGSVGYAQSALDKTIEYAQTRTQFGKPIAGFQLVQRNIVEMKVCTDAARALTYSAAKALDEGRSGRMECSIAKLYATQAGFEVANTALDVHGGIGYAVETGIERIFRDAKGAIIPEGTADVQRLIIGRELLGISAII